MNLRIWFFSHCWSENRNDEGETLHRPFNLSEISLSNIEQDECKQKLSDWRFIYFNDDFSIRIRSINSNFFNRSKSINIWPLPPGEQKLHEELLKYLSLNILEGNFYDARIVMGIWPIFWSTPSLLSTQLHEKTFSVIISLVSNYCIRYLIQLKINNAYEHRFFAVDQKKLSISMKRFERVLKMTSMYTYTSKIDCEKTDF